MDWQRAAGQGDAKAHSKTHRGRLRAPRRRRGRLGLWVLLRFRLALASRALVHYANVVTVNVVTANAMLFRLYNSGRFVHIGPKCIQFWSQIDPRSFQKTLRKALLL